MKKNITHLIKRKTVQDGEKISNTDIYFGIKVNRGIFYQWLT